MSPKAIQKPRGERIRALRERADVSLKELAAASGIDFSLISRYETGDREVSVEAYTQLTDGIVKVLESRRKRQVVERFTESLLAAQPPSLSVRALQAVLIGQPIPREVREALKEPDEVREALKDRDRREALLRRVKNTLPRRWLDHPDVQELIATYQRELDVLSQQLQRLQARVGQARDSD